MFNYLLGLFAVYVIIHFYVMQFTTTWETRSAYQRFLTIFNAVFLVLMAMGA